jgi:hypothetical protein
MIKVGAALGTIASSMTGADSQANANEEVNTDAEAQGFIFRFGSLNNGV